MRAKRWHCNACGMTAFRRSNERSLQAAINRHRGACSSKSQEVYESKVAPSASFMATVVKFIKGLGLSKNA